MVLPRTAGELVAEGYIFHTSFIQVGDQLRYLVELEGQSGKQASRLLRDLAVYSSSNEVDMLRHNKTLPLV